MLEAFLKGSTLPSERISVEEYNREIDEAASGNYLTQEEMEKQAGQW